MEKMKFKIITFLIIFGLFIHVSCGQSGLNVEKDTIPFAKKNNSGVPLYKGDKYDYLLHGFDVDSKGNYYFLSGSAEYAILSVYEGEKKISSKHYTEFHPSRIYITHDSLIVFDYYSQKNNLFILNKEEGEIIYTKKKILTNRVNAFAFLDDKIILEVFNDQPNIDMNTEIGFVEMNFAGKITASLDHGYGLLGGMKNPPFDVENPEWNSPWLLGKWRDYILFFYIDFETDNRVFILYAPETKSKFSFNVSKDVFEKEFYDPWHELMELENGIIYVVGYEDQNIIITKLSLDEMFPKLKH